MKNLSIAFLCAMSLAACRRNDNIDFSETRVLRYRQTFCADPWGRDSTDATTLASLRAFLDRQRVYHGDEQLVLDQQPDPCPDCACHTGRTFYVRVLPVQEATFISIGFAE